LTVEASEIEVRYRFAHFARQSAPRFTAKWLQSELDISESSAERILRGEASQSLIQRGIAKWKWAFAHFVLEPMAGPSQGALDDEFNDLRARLDALEGRLHGQAVSVVTEAHAAPSYEACRLPGSAGVSLPGKSRTVAR
jgi:hypothetical protein